MPKSRAAGSSVPRDTFDAALSAYASALKEVTAAVAAAIAAGKRPSHKDQPKVSWRANGMPSISDGWLNRSGPPDYPSVLDPPYGDDAARAIGRYPREHFPAVEALLDFAPGAAINAEGRPADIWRTYVTMQLEAAVNVHIDRFGQAEVTDASARLVLTPTIRGLLEPTLDIAVLAPIALTHFDFRALQLAPNVLIMKMSPALHRARWSGKAYGAKGHDSVLEAATHAFVLTNWTIENADFIRLSNTLSWPWDNSTEEFERLFAALRLVTGVETGHAQEVRLARGWRGYVRSDQPEVFAAPARRYPEGFDDFGWTKEELPRVTRADMEAVGRLLKSLNSISDRGLALALRRLNAATTRHDHADAILDAVIALEVLLGDKDNQSISWKLRMRAAALVGLSAGRGEMQAMYDGISTLYKERSAIVHGLERKASAPAPQEVRRLAVDALRRILRILIDHPRYLDPLKIDSELLLTVTAETTASDGLAL